MNNPEDNKNNQGNDSSKFSDIDSTQIRRSNTKPSTKKDSETKNNEYINKDKNTHSSNNTNFSVAKAGAGAFILILIVVIGTFSIIKAYNLIKEDPGGMLSRNIEDIVRVYEDTQTISKSQAGIITSFFDYNNIKDDDIYEMTDKNYFVFYYYDGNTKNEQEIANILTYYSAQDKSFNFYLLDLDKYGDLGMKEGLEFITTDDNGLKFTSYFWKTADEIVELPFEK